jgi:hypothetical protein
MYSYHCALTDVQLNFILKAVALIEFVAAVCGSNRQAEAEPAHRCFGGTYQPHLQGQCKEGRDQLVLLPSSLDGSQPYRPPQPVTGITLLYGDGVCFL